VMSFAVDSRRKELDSEIARATEVLYDAKILHRVQHPLNLDLWTKQMLLGYRQDFKLAIVLRGVVCSIDLARLVMQIVENDADVACGVDINFGLRRNILTPQNNINLTSGKPVSASDLLRGSNLLQARDCDASVMALSFGVGYNIRQFGRNGESDSGRRVMISPSVKSSSDPEDFRRAMQLGLMDLHGYNDNPIAWVNDGEEEERWWYITEKVWA
jgi:hypothetical protein